MQANSRKRLSRTLNLKIEIVRDNDPRCSELEARGFTLVGESWGARLRLSVDATLDAYRDYVERAQQEGIVLQELSIEYADAVLELELVNNVDYPFTPATFHSIPTLESIQSLWKDEARIFGALVGKTLVGVISTSRSGETVELDFASVLREQRGKGIGKALAATAILAWVEQGVQVFATGGATVNAASLGTVRSLGFAVDESWRSYQPPM